MYHQKNVTFGFIIYSIFAAYSQDFINFLKQIVIDNLTKHSYNHL